MTRIWKGLIASLVGLALIGAMPESGSGSGGVCVDLGCVGGDLKCADGSFESLDGWKIEFTCYTSHSVQPE